MSVGMILLTVTAVLVFFGAAQRVLDKLYLTDRAALVLIALMFFGTLIPNLTIGSVSISIGGAVIPIGICAYVLAKADTNRERVRALAGSLITGGAVYLLSAFMPDEPEAILIDPLYVYGLVGGLVGYVLGRSRRGAFICGILGVLAVVGILRGLGNVTIVQAYRNASWVFWIGGACLLVWAVLKLMSMAKSKAVLDTEESTHILTNLERTCSAVYTELAVPAHAKEVDILSFFYKVKDGQIKPCEKGMQVTPYIAPVFKAFADAQQLYLVNLEGKYAIPLDSIRAIQTVKKHIRVSGWNKEEACNQGFYKQFKLTTDQYGCVHSKQYYILEFTHGG